jgi:hypothetical protein
MLLLTFPEKNSNIVRHKIISNKIDDDCATDTEQTLTAKIKVLKQLNLGIEKYIEERRPATRSRAKLVIESF